MKPIEHTLTMTEQQRKWLDLVRMSKDGQREDLIPPKVARWMERSGYVDRRIPTNPSHYERFVITSAGIAALSK